jgi:arginyl-tRNA--protein-N-Asp/Glu arginylyltransferase
MRLRLPGAIFLKTQKMKLLFSEAAPDYSHYIFPYAIWAFPEAGERPQHFFEKGFLPSSKNLDRFYLCRSVRVALPEFSPSSENRRVMRKCANISFELFARENFAFTAQWREFCLMYADIKFGKEIMNAERLDNLMNAKITSHLLLFYDNATSKNVGLATLFLEPPHVTQYYYAFYDLNYYRQNLGMYMMTAAIEYFAKEKFAYIYLGSCYSRNALYKTQFAGAEFFNGARWSRNLEELKYLIERGNLPVTQHLFESENYLHQFYEGELGKLVEKSVFSK